MMFELYYSVNHMLVILARLGQIHLPRAILGVDTVRGMLLWNCHNFFDHDRMSDIIHIVSRPTNMITNADGSQFQRRASMVRCL